MKHGNDAKADFHFEILFIHITITISESLMSGSCHIRRVEIVVALGIFVCFFKFSAEQKSDLKEYKSL
jgi:hypothetical protein